MKNSESTPPDGSLSQRLARLFGPDAEPHISLAEPRGPDATSEMVVNLLNKEGDQQRYEVRGEIDRGGMGVVLDVWDRDLRRPLAMKIALQQEPDQPLGGRLIARFLEEAQITAQLDHPGVVPVHELGVNADGRVFFTMRRIRGRDLREVLHCVHYSLDGWNATRALSVLLRVCEAVAFAHSRGVVHRDLKPANIIVGEFGEVYVVDWGLARVLGRKVDDQPSEANNGPLNTVLRDERTRSPVSELVTSHGDVFGTPAYMPPEQARGEVEDPSPLTDVYAIGAILYHLLAHDPPYFPSSQPTTQIEALKALRSGPPQPLAELRAGIAPALAAICEKSMAFAPEDRYANVQELADDLRAFLEQRVVGAYETGAMAEARQWLRRNRPLAAALVSALLLLVVGLFATGRQYVRAEGSATLARAEATRADAEAQTAVANAERARNSEVVALAEKQKVLRLSDAKRLEYLTREAHSLWPAVPEKLSAMESWLNRARVLADQHEQHAATLAGLREQALPYDAQARRLDQATHPQANELVQVRADMATLIDTLDGLQGDVLQRADETVAALEEHSLLLEDRVQERRTWQFVDVQLQWQHDLLTDLVVGLDRLTGSSSTGNDSTGNDSTGNLLADVEQRFAFASDLEARTLSDPTPAALWAEALEASRKLEPYAGLELRPQLGLLPLGLDPDSGLLEFSHLASGEPAVRDVQGRLVMEEASGVVLVLIPGGRFLMGSQAFDPSGPAYDPQATSEESPVHQVQLAPFFLSKFEMTQAQWLRIRGSNPSLYGPHMYSPGWNRAGKPADLLHPVEMISWTDCKQTLSMLDLDLPTEAQWEYAARAGTTTIWWTGNDAKSLQGAVNVADRFGLQNGAGGWPAFETEIDDGNTSHATIGSYRPNRFGLHDTAGNVFEWCKDGYGTYASEPGLGDGARVSVNPGAHPRRGGGYSLSAYDARSACRNPGNADATTDALGVRPSRELR